MHHFFILESKFLTMHLFSISDRFES
jgi:hypothetical protein